MKGRLKLFRLLGLSAVFLGALGACGPREKPNFVYMPDMAYSPSVKAQEEGSNRMPPYGTIPRGFEPYPYPHDPELAGQRLQNPLQRTRANFYKGQESFNIFCAVCHGPSGEGDGSIVPQYPRPPSLLSDKIRGWSDGRIYHVISKGQGLMPAYERQVDPEDRWAIALYIRALHRAAQPTPDDLERAETW
jgi:mono/diheme cytochrome c family protein